MAVAGAAIVPSPPTFEAQAPLAKGQPDDPPENAKDRHTLTHLAGSGGRAELAFCSSAAMVDRLSQWSPS